MTAGGALTDFLCDPVVVISDLARRGVREGYCRCEGKGAWPCMPHACGRKR